MNELYPPSASKSNQSKSTTKSLVRKLKKKGPLDDFHAQMVKSVKEDHCVMLTKEEAKEMLKKNHYFSGINYATKAGSTSHKIRLVTNSSSNHMNGSLNSHMPKGVNLLGSLKNTFTKFRLHLYAIMLDLSRAYRSLYSSMQRNELCLMWWINCPTKAIDDLEQALAIYKLVRVTYGDQAASGMLKLALRRIIAPECKTKLGQEILAGDRFVDDVLTSHENKELLTQALDDIVQTLENHSFLIKRIISNKRRDCYQTLTLPQMISSQLRRLK